MARKIIKLSGGSYERLKSLSGNERLQGREVVVTTDTKELFVGNGDGTFSLLGTSIIGDSNSQLQTIDPLEGRFFFNNEKKILYIGNGNGWKTIGVKLLSKGGLIENDQDELSVAVDGVSILINEKGQLTFGNTDYGIF